jgi:hypothetical protein
MAKGKPTPDKSKIERTRPLAYSRRQKGSGGLGGPAASGEKDKDEDDDDKDEKDDKDKAAEPAKSESPSEPEAKVEAEAKADEPPAIEPPPPKGEPWPDATPQPMRPVEPARARTETVAMPPELVTGAPPAMPTGDPSSVEDPTFMPVARNVPAGHPDDPASPPGRVPSGDSRSLRKDTEFALVYRVGTAVITRSGVVGTRGKWRVVDYPTSSSASNAYAKEVSRFVAEGFSDYRD